MQVVKRIIDNDAWEAIQAMNEWFYAQNEYEEGRHGCYCKAL
ncbi:hypothetical protein IMSAG049_00043 [Clostridiales bacterium]|nr:hypothetical protein IMSAG049_00043 [Clostridiales bacterium]